jgi:hypothetical protein
MNQEDSNKATSKLNVIYKVLETMLVSEIILLILGGVFVSNLHPFLLRIFYWIVIPWSILITGILFIIVRHLRR